MEKVDLEKLAGEGPIPLYDHEPLPTPIVTKRASEAKTRVRQSTPAHDGKDG